MKRIHALYLISLSAIGFALVQLSAPAHTSQTICNYSVTPTSRFLDNRGGEARFTVMAPAGCSWEAIAIDEWIIITSSEKGSGMDTVSYAVRENFDSASRQGTISVAGEKHTVIQSGNDAGECSYTISPQSASIDSTGGRGRRRITTRRQDHSGRVCFQRGQG